MNIRNHNRRAWNRAVHIGSRWSVPVSPEVIANARTGNWRVLLTPRIPVPRAWFGDLEGANLLCLASGGGQQAPILAAAGAHVAVLDNSPAQLARDQEVATREGLELVLVEGDMADLSSFGDGSFDLVYHPVANCFVPSIRPVWREAYRVLRPGGVLLAGFCNPLLYLFDDDETQRSGELRVRYRLPYADTEQLSEERLERLIEEEEPLEFGHSLEDQIGGQLDAGFLLTGFYEDRFPDDDHLICQFAPSFIATRAVRPL